MNDYLVRIIAKTASVRALACATSDLVKEACQRHSAYPTPCVALGRGLTAGALMGALLKTGQRVALKFEGNGPLQKIVVEAESNGAVRGYVSVPDVDLPPKDGKIDVAGALGRKGFLTVTKDLRLKEPYKGTVRLHTGEIAEDLAYYLTESEQIPSAVGLGVFVEPEAIVSAAGGFLIQSFPPYDDDIVDRLIHHIGEMPPITELIRRGTTPEEILEILFADIPFETLEKRPLSFRCSCSRERVERAIISLGPEEIVEITDQQERVEVTCEFCLERYDFTRDQLHLILEKSGNTRKA